MVLAGEQLLDPLALSLGQQVDTGVQGAANSVERSHLAILVFVRHSMTMTRQRRTAGGLELMSLLAVADLGAEAYGLSVRRDVSRRCGHEYSVGAIYTTLSRLEKKGWITSSLTSPQPVRGGRARRHFQIAAPGVRALAEARRQSDLLWQSGQSANGWGRGGVSSAGEQPA